jgi:CsoR family transcriptional regulator, copper-sensing transcriptional repressor
MPRSERTGAHTERADKVELLKRLNRIGGQIEGIARMVGEDRYCIDILTQIAAARSALDAFGLKLLHHHASGCVQDAVRSGDGDKAIDELMKVIERLAR